MANDETGTDSRAFADDCEAKRLLKLVEACNEAAFTSLYRMQNRAVYAFVLNHLRSPTEAEEVMVDTMYEVWRHAGRFQGQSRVRTWILGIARNKMLMKLRSLRRADHDDVDELPESVEYELVRDAPDAVDLIALTQERDGVRKCLDKLAGMYRECLHLFYFEECSVAEIAAVQQVNENRVKGRLFQARIKIKTCLSNLCRATGRPA